MHAIILSNTNRLYTGKCQSLTRCQRTETLTCEGVRSMRGILSTDRECPGKAVSTDGQFCCISEGNLRLAVQDKDASTRHQ